MTVSVKQTQPTHALSFTNKVTSGTVTGSSEDAEYPATNVQDAGRPFMPWRTAALGEQTLVADLSSAPAGKVLVVLNRVNFTTATFQANTSDSWGAPAVSQAITIANNPFNGRYQHTIVFDSLAYQFVRLVIASQTPTDNAAYYLVGGLWVGEATIVPSNVMFDIEIETVEPREDLQPGGDQWRQQLYLGDPYVRLTMERLARVTRVAPGRDNDQLARWAALDRSVHTASRFAFFLNKGDATQGYIMLNAGEVSWRREHIYRAKSNWVLEESLQ